MASNRPDRNASSGGRESAPLLTTMLVGAATWLAVLLLLFVGVRQIVRATRTASEKPETNGLTDYDAPEAAHSGNPLETPPKIITGEKVDYTALKRGDTLYGGSVATLVLLDLPDFSSTAQLSAEQLIAFGVWESLKNPLYSDSAIVKIDRVYVSAQSVALAVQQELGYTGTMEHRSISLPGEFLFDVITQRYSAPAYGIETGAYAVVDTCTVKDGRVTLQLTAYQFPDGLEYDTSSVETTTRGMTVELDCSGEVPVILSLQTRQAQTPPAAQTDQNAS